MNIEQLKVFLAVANNSSFTITANKLNMSQSSVSKNIKELELFLECRLFQRTTRSVRLTSEGQYFYGIAKNVVNSINSAIFNLKKQTKTFTIGYMNTYADKIFMPMLLKNILKKYPNWNINVNEVFLDDTINGLIHGNSMIVFGEKDCFKNDCHIEFLPLFKSRYVVITSPQSEFKNKKIVRISDLKSKKLVLGNIRQYLPTEQSLHDKIIDQIGGKYIEYADDMMIMALLVKSENILGILPEYGVDKTDKSLLYLPLATDISTIFGFGYLDTIQYDINMETLFDLIKNTYYSYRKEYC